MRNLFDSFDRLLEDLKDPLFFEKQSPEIKKAATEAAERIASRPPPTDKEIIDRSVDFILNCPLGEDE